jgi:O-antigen/teichoic acid export membrane protein
MTAAALTADPVPPKPVNRSGRLVATIASGWLRTSFTVTIGLFATPLLLRFLGAQRFGVIRAADQWFAYLQFFNFGLAGAAGVLLLKAVASGPRSEVAATARAGLRLLFRQLVWVLPAAVFMLIAFPFAIDLPAELLGEFCWAAPAILIGVVLSPLGLFSAVLEARQEGYWVNLGLAAQAAAVAGFGVAAAVLGFGLAGQFCATVLGAATFSGMSAYLVGATQQEFWAAPASTLPRRDVRQLRWPLLIAGVGNQINLLSDGLLAGVLLGVGEVATLVLTQRIFQIATVVGSSLNGSSIWAGLFDLRAKAGHAAFRSRLAEVSKLNVGTNMLVLAPILGYNQRFVGLWVGDAMYAGDLVTFATFAQLAVFNFFCLYSAMIDSFGLTRRRVWVSTAGTAVKIGLVFPLTAWFGLAGLPLATAAAYLCTDAWFCPWVLQREAGPTASMVLGGLGRAIGVGSSWGGLCYLVGTRTAYLLPGWPGLFAETFVMEIGGLAIGWLFLLSAAERIAWRQRVRGWFGRQSSKTSPTESTEI